MEPDMESEYDFLATRRGLERLYLGPESDDASSVEKLLIKYPAKLHARRVAAELGVDDGLVYLQGQPEAELRDSDQSVPFRQRRYFFYVSGANFADCHATYCIASDQLTLWIPHVEPKDVLWFGTKPSPEQCMELYDVSEVRYASELAEFVGRYGGRMFVLHADQMPPGVATGPSSGERRGAEVDDGLLRPAMDRARVTKTGYEIAMIRRANDVSSAAHRAVAEQLLRLEGERDVEAVFQAACTRRGTRTQAYPVIAGAGAHAATLHYTANDGGFGAGQQLLLLDAGCEWDCYASDVTRTLPLAGAFAPRAAAVHAVVERMQDACIAAVRPGVLFRDLHLRAADVALDGLLRLGVLRGDRADIVRAGTVAAFFPHGLGHHVGLEVHDVSGPHPLLPLGRDEQQQQGQPSHWFGAKRATVTPDALAAMARRDDDGHGPAALRPNMVVTIEPGLYFCRPYLEARFVGDARHARFIDPAALEAYYPVGGVRIEDCVLVTARGHEVLTTAPKGAELIDVINHALHPPPPPPGH